MKKISTKLLIMIMMIFAFQALVFMLFQNFFLDAYYIDRKIGDIEEALEMVIEHFEYQDITDQSSGLRTFMSEVDEPIIVIEDDEFHDSTYFAAFERTVELLIEDEFYTFVIDEIDFYLLEDYDLNQLEVLVYGVESDEFYPLQLEVNQMLINNISLLYVSGSEVIKEGVIVDYDAFQYSDLMLDKQNALIDYYYGGIEDTRYEYILETRNIEGSNLTFITMVSLQPINEIIDIQSTFQMYLMIFVFLLIIILGLVVSRMISKPIIEVMHNASEISNYNFDVVCDETRHDEIGLLGKEINKLSRSLKEKINDLEMTNLKLEDEIEFERKQESIRQTFVADVSHELKTPLGVIKSYSEGIRDGISKERVDDYLAIIIEEVSKMNELIMNMLELSHIESKMKAVQFEKVNIRRMIQNILRSYEPIIENNDIELTFEISDQMVLVDVHLMELVLNNLLSNSIRYMTQPNQLSVVLNDHTLIIKNSADKIDDHAISKLFDRFYRVEKSRSKELGGNGLGLSLVKEALDMQNISYSIESTSCFEFKLLFQEV